MAIKKQSHFKGYIAEYWKIKKISKINFENGEVEFYMHEFKDEETRRESLENELNTTQIIVKIDDLNGNIRKQIYEKLMQDEKFFKEGESC